MVLNHMLLMHGLVGFFFWLGLLMGAGGSIVVGAGGGSEKCVWLVSSWCVLFLE